VLEIDENLVTWSNPQLRQGRLIYNISGQPNPSDENPGLKFCIENDFDDKS